MQQRWVGQGRRWLSAAAVATAIGLGVSACGGSDDADGASEGAKAELRFSYFAGQGTSFGKLWTWWMEEVTKRSNGEITFEEFWDGTLLKPDEVSEGLKDGRVDVAQVTPSYHAGKFPLTTVADLPFRTRNVPAATAAMAELAVDNDALRAEWEGQGLEPVAWNVAPNSGFGSKQAIRTVEDLRGKKVRGVDRGAKSLSTVGANILTVAVQDMYGAMERDLINAYYGIPLGFVGPMKLNEVSGYMTDLGMGTSTASALAMSSAGWEKLSDAHRKVIEEVAADVPAKLGEFDAEAEDASCEALRESNTEVSVLPDSEVEKLRAAISDKVNGEWERDIGKDGAPAAELREQHAAAVEKQESQFPDFVGGVQRCLDAPES